MTMHESTVKVALGERSYDIRIKPGIIQEIGRCLIHLGLSGRAAIVTNPVVGRLYAPAVKRSLSAAGYEVLTIVIPDGERAKTLRSVGGVLDRLATARFERQSLVVALGGGVIGDLAGFAAAVYARGVPFVQVPTTLVAQVDSSVGGKTGVNLPVGKNLVGAFHQPRQVLIDPQTLRTLPRREWVAGLAEVIKYGVIADDAFFAYLEERMSEIQRLEPEPVRRIVTRSCEIKAAVVMEDEREADRRRILNYGHTVGHALESLSGYRRLVHGEAVAIGMVQEAALSCSIGLCAEETVTRLRTLLQAVGLPTELPPLTFQQLWGAMQHDKKVSHGRLNCVLPEGIGRVVIAPLEEQQVRRWFETRETAARVRSAPRRPLKRRAR
jgi:3-dehydroquinate synthase